VSSITFPFEIIYEGVFLGEKIYEEVSLQFAHTNKGGGTETAGLVHSSKPGANVLNGLGLSLKVRTLVSLG
jgi:hypothetical protein